MKIAHISDLHLGKMLHGYSLAEDQSYIFQKIIEIMKKNKVDVLLIAGDIYDKNIPSVEGIKILRKFLNDIVAEKITVMLISGNHDNAERLTFGSEFMEDKGIYFSSVYEGFTKCVTLEDEFGKINFYLLPFIKPSTVRHYYPEEKIDTYEDAVRFAIEKMQVNKRERNIIVSHQNIIDAQTCESEEHIIGGLDAISADIYEDFDYAALGHIHTPQSIKDSVVYCGTPIKYSISEIQNDKTMPVVTFGKKGDVKKEFFELKPLHDIRQITGNYREIISMSKDDPYSREDYISIILKDENVVPDAITNLRSIYPNILQLSYDNSETNNGSEIIDSDEYTRASPFELFKEFYRNRKKIEMDEDQIAYIQSLIEQIWGGEE